MQSFRTELELVTHSGKVLVEKDIIDDVEVPLRSQQFPKSPCLMSPYCGLLKTDQRKLDSFELVFICSGLNHCMLILANLAGRFCINNDLSHGGNESSTNLCL